MERKKIKVNGPGRLKLEQERKHIWLYFDLLHAFNGEHSSALGFNRGDLHISASAVPSEKDTCKRERNGKLQNTRLFKHENDIWKWPVFVIINELLRNNVIANYG